MSSFAKAKIHRFNEETTCAPPPGKYDPKMDTKIKGAALPMLKRFPNQQCSSSSLDSIDKPISTLPAFRTPQLQRKKLIKMTSTEKLNLVKGFCNSASSSSCKSEEQIPIGTKQISRADCKRLGSELSDYGQQLRERDLKIKQLKEDLEKLKKNEHDMLSNKQNEQIVTLQTEKADIELIRTEKQNAIVAINDKYLDLERELKILREENCHYLDYITRLEEANVQTVEIIVTESEQKIEQLETNFNAKLKSLENDFSDAQQEVEVDFIVYVDKTRCNNKNCLL